MSAKFIAQIEMSKTFVPRYSEPADATSPRIVSISGSPAATSDPKASTRMTSVTGQEISSLFIIAERFAVLKSDHIPLAPVTTIETPGTLCAFNRLFRWSAARTMVFESAMAPAWMTAVRPSREIEVPDFGATTSVTRGSVLRIASADVIAFAKPGLETVCPFE